MVNNNWRTVTSLAEVWIEISSSVAVQSMSWPSLPLRKCGLKWLKMFCTFVLCWVTSLAEVWIEIWSSVKSRRVQGVTSLAEVWIEICCYVMILYGLVVTSLRVVWIEISDPLHISDVLPVTSLAEVWIEMLIRSLIRVASASLPLRKCGLKYGAAVNGYDAGSHFPCGSVDWNLQWKPVNSCNKRSLPLRKCGLKSFVSTYAITAHGHFPCGSVDWNICEVGVGVGVWVTSLAEVWIEILSRSTYGNPRSKCYHHKYYKDLLKSLDLPDIHFHQLRNTYATILLKNSFNSKGVSHL